MQKKLILIIAVCILALGYYFFMRNLPAGIEVTTEPNNSKVAIFPNTCIDTMKVSRDRARELENNPQAAVIVKRNIDIIKSLGATCVAIGTPYDEEFQPYMNLWVSEARKAGLSVWFRGNWSGWEGWFSYEKNMTPDEHIEKTVAFINNHADMFQDGDIFSPIVEPENGGPFHPFTTEERKIGLREYLQEEQAAVQDAFRGIDKKVTTSWISLSGGVARSMIDQETVDALDGTVTLDHYVADPSGMREYIDLFHEPFGAQIVFGEFGAPIPDINGEMNEKEQAAFVDDIMWELFLERKKIEGINYWTLTESSTALVHGTQELLPVTDVLKRYYNPGEVRVKVTDNHNKPIDNVIISAKENDPIDRTNEKGEAVIIMPQGTYTLNITSTTGKSLSTPITVIPSEITTVRATFDK